MHKTTTAWPDFQRGIGIVGPRAGYAVWLALCATGLTCVILLVPGSAGSKEARPAEEVRAERFILVDKDGREQGVFGFTQGGHPGLRIGPVEGGMTAELQIDRSGMPRFGLMDDQGRAIVGIGVLEKNLPVIVLKGPNGERQVAMTVSKDGTPYVGLYDSEKRARSEWKLDANGNPVLVLRDQKGQGRGLFGVVGPGIAAMSLMNPQGREGVVFQVNQDGHADGVIYERDGAPKWRSATSSKKPE